MSEPAEVPLVTTLQIAVPSWIADVADLPAKERLTVLRRWRDTDAELMLTSLEEILYPVDQPEQSAQAFNALARGLAVLAHQPGGVRAFGLVWCAAHSPAGAATQHPCCALC